jgi:hypothetical protein
LRVAHVLFFPENGGSGPLGISGMI